MAGDFVVQVAETALNRMGPGTICGQKQQHEAGMLPQPALDRSGLVNLAVVRHHLDPIKAPGRVSTGDDVQQLQKQPGHLAKPKAVMHLARA